MAIRELAVTRQTLVDLAARCPQEFPVLLDSAAPGALGRWSVLAAYPVATLRLLGDGSLVREGNVPAGEGFLTTLARWWSDERCESVPCTAPFHGGWMLFLGYELAAEIEPGLRVPRAGATQTVAMAMRVPAAVLYDHDEQHGFALAEAGAEHLLDRIGAATRQPSQPLALTGVRLASCVEDAPELFYDQVIGAQRFIAAGDLYQANLSRGWQAQLAANVSDSTLYRALRAANPAPFAAWWQHAHLRLMSSSPERLVRIAGTRVETRPIAGTRPRSRNPRHEFAELRELLASPKERAEHVMLIDLERNDLGRVCEAGTVRVEEFMVTESYQHVHHIVSGVGGRLRGDCGPVDVIRAVFPGGTITGCPKYRCMQLIGELERAPRGAYTGSVGYLNRDGSMDLNILIRTLVRHQDTVTLRAGAGIVADSNWQLELQETRAKARGMLRALGVTA